MSLSILGLSVSYGTGASTSQALLDLTLTVATSERFAVMGPSGSGKSTLLRAIAGLVPIDSGEIDIDGHPMTDTPAHKRPVGLMFQDYALFPHMSVVQNVAYGPRVAGVSARRRNTLARDLLAMVGLDGFSDRNPATLSGGEQQRVALARTLAAEPSVVLLDEPLGSLDVSLRESLLAETRSILEEVGATSVYVTHDSTEAFSFCDRMAIIHDGRILRVGTPDEIWHDPQSTFAARAIGQSNLIPLSLLAPGRTGVGFVPLDATVAGSHGRLSGVVKSTRFEDGNHVVTIRITDSASTMELRIAETAHVGMPIRFDVNNDEVIVVSVDEV